MKEYNFDESYPIKYEDKYLLKICRLEIFVAF